MNTERKLEQIYESIYSELSSEEEMDILSPSTNVRNYKENDYVSLKNGGEGTIVKILSCL